MANRKLNRTKPFDTCHGQDEDSRAFAQTQNGQYVYFNHLGEEISCHAAPAAKGSDDPVTYLADVSNLLTTEYGFSDDHTKRIIQENKVLVQRGLVKGTASVPAVAQALSFLADPTDEAQSEAKKPKRTPKSMPSIQTALEEPPVAAEETDPEQTELDLEHQLARNLA